MESLKARVRNGRLVLDVPTSLPEGTEIELAASDPDDDLDDEQRARLHDAIDRGVDELKQGRGVPAEDVIHELKRKR